MRQFSITTDIYAPTERVWKVMSDIERWHEWTPSVRSVKLLKGEPLSVGSRALIRQPKLLPAVWKVTAIEEGRGFTWVNAAPGLRVVANHSIEPTEAGSRAILSLDFQGLFGGLLARMTKGINERYLAQESEGLKARSENPAYHCAARRSE